MGRAGSTPVRCTAQPAPWLADGRGPPAMRVKEPAGQRWLWLALAISALLSTPYLLVVRDFFFTDDWVHLQYNGMIPPWQVWRYFSPRVIWFYRPLQALQFGWLYHCVGLRPLAYNLCLLLMHFSVCVLVYLLATR